MLENFLKTSEQELQEVLEGKKPAALGYWEHPPDKILRFELLPVFGRFYDMAIALTKENLNRVVMAYYIPLSIEGDIELGKALGYDEKDIIEYTKIQIYPKPVRKINKEERTILKVKAEIQKVGIEKVNKYLEDYLNGDENAKHLVEKEGLDIKVATKYIIGRKNV